MSRDSPAQVRPVTPRTYHHDQVYIRLRFLICFSSLSNVLNHHASMYLARLIASNQAYSQLLSRSVTLRLTPYQLVLCDQTGCGPQCYGRMTTSTPTPTPTLVSHCCPTGARTLLPPTSLVPMCLRI